MHNVEVLAIMCLCITSILAIIYELIIALTPIGPTLNEYPYRSSLRRFDQVQHFLAYLDDNCLPIVYRTVRVYVWGIIYF